MKNLRSDIEAMFAELNGATDYEAQLEEAGHYKRAAAVERTRQWRRDNPERFRAQRRKYAKAWKRRHPDKFRAAKKRRRQNATGAAREKLRAQWRKTKAAQRARARR